MLASFLVTLAASFLATLGFGVLLNAPRRALLRASLLGAAAQGLFFGLTVLGCSEQLAIFLAAGAASLMAELTARHMRMAVTVFVTLSIIPLVPGLALYRSMAALAQGLSDSGVALGTSAMVSFLMIALGVALGSFMARIGRGERMERTEKGGKGAF